MLTKKDLKINKSAFKKWLESKKPNEIVGYPGNTGSCPIAQYLNYKNRNKLKDKVDKESFMDIRVTAFADIKVYDHTFAKSNIPIITLLSPLSRISWNSEFVEKIDKYKVPITAKKALKVLESIK